MKTAITELIEKLISFKGNTSGDMEIDINYFKQKEREQIVNAHIAGQLFASDNDNYDSEEHFKNTYEGVNRRKCFECDSELDNEELFCTYCRRQ